MAISLSSKDEPNPARWVAALAAPSCRRAPQQKSPRSHITNSLLTKLVRSWWLDIGLVFVFWVYMDLDSFSGKLHWTEQSSWPHAWSITHVHRPSTQPTLSVAFKTSPTYLLFQPQHMDTKQSMEDGHHGLHGTPAIKPAAMESSTG